MDQDPNIIDMSPFLRDTRHPAIREVEAYWQALRGARLVPRRAEVDPRGIERALEYAFILERIAPGLARLRIAGSHLGELLGMEVRGMPLSAFFTPDARSLCCTVLEEVFDAPATAELTLTAEGGIGKPALEGKLLLLPMKSDLNDVSRALGCFSTRGGIGRAPRRFDIAAHRINPLRAGPEDPDDPRAAPPAAAGFADAPAGYRPPRRAPDRPYLRLVQEDEGEDDDRT